MKKMFLSACVLAASLVMQAAQPRLVVQQIDNQGQVPGHTYRLYCVLDAGQTLQVVYGDQDHPLSIRTEGELFHHDFGGNTSSSVNAALAESVPTLKYDSWVTVGFENSNQNDLWELGVNFEGFASNSQMLVDNGGWFLIPTNAKCTPNDQGLLLLGQFTTTGVVSGSLNLQGKDASNGVWQALELTFSTAKSNAFGCNDKAANNYSPDAEFHDPNACTYKSGSVKPVATPLAITTSDWSVFPNPLRDNQINIQLNQTFDAVNTPSSLQIVDQKGQLIVQRDIQPGDIINNKLVLTQDLSAGTYQIVWHVNGKSSAKTLVVQK
jgi:hypothetical protein